MLCAMNAPTSELTKGVHGGSRSASARERTEAVGATDVSVRRGWDCAPRDARPGIAIGANMRVTPIKMCPDCHLLPLTAILEKLAKMSG